MSVVGECYTRDEIARWASCDHHFGGPYLGQQSHCPSCGCPSPRQRVKAAHIEPTCWRNEKGFSARVSAVDHVIDGRWKPFLVSGTALGPSEQAARDALAGELKRRTLGEYPGTVGPWHGIVQTHMYLPHEKFRLNALIEDLHRAGELVIRESGAVVPKHLVGRTSWALYRADLSAMSDVLKTDFNGETDRLRREAASLADALLSPAGTTPPVLQAVVDRTTLTLTVGTAVVWCGDAVDRRGRDRSLVERFPTAMRGATGWWCGFAMMVACRGRL